jgi:adenosylhomocysteine nucleosidase
VITGIIVALPEELSTLTSKRLKKGCIGHVDENLWVVCSGAGPEKARVASEALVKDGANCLISWGCAAALDASLRPGDLVLAISCVDADLKAFDLNNKGWVSYVKSSLGNSLSVRIYTGRLAESKNIVSSGREKVQIASATSAIALDMESAAIARVAQTNGLPFISIRAIADPLSMDLPVAVSYSLNEHGDVVLARLLTYLFLHPAELPGLVKLGLHFNAAKNTLKQVAKQINAVTTLPKDAFTIIL